MSNSETADPPTVIVLTVDGLSASMLGPYGNTAVETPAIDTISAASTTYEFAIVRSPALVSGMTSLWRPNSDSWLTDGVAGRSILVSDDTDIAALGEQAQFERIVPVNSPPVSKLASDLAATQTARFFIAAIEAVESMQPGDFCWLHFQGLTGPWDAPLEYRLALADEDDPDPPESFARPIRTFNAADIDPDELLGYQQSAFAQVQILDECIALLMERIGETPELEDVAWVLTSPRGYPLGEHGIVGSWDNVYNESLHVPLMIRNAGQRLGQRNFWLTQDDSVSQASARLIAGEEETGTLWPVTEAEVQQTIAQSKTENWSSIQTPEWKLIESADGETTLLYSKPDDRWEVNDVSRRCPAIVDELIARRS